MPFKHFIQKIEGRLPEYTSANKPKFPYCFSGLRYDHQLVGLINGEEDLSDPGMIVTTNAAFLWRATPQGHDFWEEYDDYLFVDLPSYVQDIIYGWVEEFDVGEEVEFESVEEDIEYVGRPISPGSVVWVDESSPWSDEDIRTLLEELAQPTR